MFKTFWTTLFVIFGSIILMANICFTFDLVNVVNPTANSLLDNGDYYHNYYFGMSSFIDAFEEFFGNESTFLSRFNSFLLDIGQKVSALFAKNGFINSITKISGSKNVNGILVALVTIAMLLISGAPMILLIAYGVLWVLYLVIFAAEVVLFIFSFFAGAFKTPLPSTDWYEYQYNWDWIQNTSSALLV